MQFLIVCPIAIACYTEPFSLLDDYCSILGIFDGAWTPSAWMFNGSLVVLGAGLFRMFSELFRIKVSDMDDLLVCAGCGMCASVALAMIGLVPLSVSIVLHNVVMCACLFFTVSALIFWADWQRLNKGRSGFGRPAIAAILIYPFAVVAGRGPAVQKGIVLFSLAWMLYLCWQLLRAIRSGDVRTWLAPPVEAEKVSRPAKVRYIENPFHDE